MLSCPGCGSEVGEDVEFCPKCGVPLKEKSGSVNVDFATAASERTIHLNSGVLIGLGIGLILLGLFGWLSVNQTYTALRAFFAASMYDPNRYYLFRNLIDLIASYMMIALVGVASLLVGVLYEKNRAARVSLTRKDSNARWGNGLMAAGGVFAFTALRFLFIYILAQDFFNLQLFVVFAAIGVFLLILGIMIYRQKNN